MPSLGLKLRLNLGQGKGFREEEGLRPSLLILFLVLIESKHMS